MAGRPNYVQEIERSIEATRSVVEEHGRKIGGLGREYQTRYWLIDPILRALGWDVNAPGQVWVEYPINGRFPDYAFFTQGSKTPIMILEAKSIPDVDLSDLLGEEFTGVEDWDDDDDYEDDLDDSDDEDWDDEDYLREFPDEHIEQLIRQCRRLTRGYGVLSRGSLWSIYDLSVPGNPRTANGFLRKRIAHFNILSSPVEECVEHLRRLHRRNLR